MNKKIINSLLIDADMTTRDIASRVRVSIGTVHNRIERLKKGGVIKRKVLLVDYEKLGYNIAVMIAIKTNKGGFYELAKELDKDPAVFLVIDMTGEYDAEILARFRTTRELDNFVKGLQQRVGIKETSTRLILNIYREKHIQ